MIFTAFCSEKLYSYHSIYVNNLIAYMKPLHIGIGHIHIYIVPIATTVTISKLVIMTTMLKMEHFIFQICRIKPCFHWSVAAWCMHSASY